MLNLIQHLSAEKHKLKLVLRIELIFQIKFAMTNGKPRITDTKQGIITPNIPRHAELDSFHNRHAELDSASQHLININ